MFVMFFSCSNAQKNGLILDSANIKSIEITYLETGENKELINKSEINSLINAINRNEKEIVKFKPKIKIEIFTDKDNVLLLLYADGYFKHNGKSYKLKQQLEF